MVVPFGRRLARGIADRGRLCVGIDPHPGLLERWDLPVTASGAEEFAFRVIEAAARRVAVVKPQVAFFERYGADGFKALEQIIPAAREQGLLVIADVKRGEIGSSMDGYVDAWLDPTAKLAADAITVNPYLGFGSLASTIEAADRWGKGVYVLCATSNAEAGPVQRAGDPTVTARIAEAAAQTNRARWADELRTGDAQAGGLGSVGLVIGATVDIRDYGVDPDALAGTPVLAPGAGFQGGSADDVRETLGRLAEGALVSQSRSILAAGPKDIAAAVDHAADETDRAVRA